MFPAEHNEGSTALVQEPRGPLQPSASLLLPRSTIRPHATCSYGSLKGIVARKQTRLSGFKIAYWLRLRARWPSLAGHCVACHPGFFIGRWVLTQQSALESLPTTNPPFSTRLTDRQETTSQQNLYHLLSHTYNSS